MCENLKNLSEMDIVKYFENPSLSTVRNSELNEYRQIGKFTDVTLKSTDGKTMTVHKNVLSASCPYFKGMFNSDLVETRQDLIQLVDDVTIADLEILIEYMYIGKAKISLSNAENIFIKAQYFQLVELSTFCSEILIENIKIENCLRYLRKSEKYLIGNLKTDCEKFIKLHCKSFLELNVMSLTAEEFKGILSEEIVNIGQEDLYKFVAEWVKADFESRNDLLIQFIGKINFSMISEEFIQSEIMSDDKLMKSREFSEKIFNIRLEKLQNVTKQLNLKLEEYNKKSYSKSLKNIYLTTNSGIYKLNWNEWKWTNEFNFANEKSEGFASTAFKGDIFISGGKDLLTILSIFESWNASSLKITILPPMIESRYAHELIDFNGKIYCCGGVSNNGSIEKFDFENLKWSTGPAMNENKFWFDLITAENSIYAFGGLKTETGWSNMVEQFDEREGKWNVISRDAPNITQATILSNKSVYCFKSFLGGKIFDLRTNTWTDSLAKAFERKDGLTYYLNCTDIVEFNNEIFGVFQTDDSRTWGTFKYEPNTNKWEDLNIKLNLNPSNDIKLCVI